MKPPSTTKEFIKSGRLCLGGFCTWYNPKGLVRVPSMFRPGSSVCLVCENEAKHKVVAPPFSALIQKQEPKVLRFFSKKLGKRKGGAR